MLFHSQDSQGLGLRLGKACLLSWAGVKKRKGGVIGL